MDSWKRWKAKHWDEKEHPGYSDDMFISPPYTETPRFRAWCRALILDVERNPLRAIGTIGGLIAGVIGGVIALARWVL